MVDTPAWDVKWKGYRARDPDEIKPQIHEMITGGLFRLDRLRYSEDEWSSLVDALFEDKRWDEGFPDFDQLTMRRRLVAWKLDDLSLMARDKEGWIKKINRAFLEEIVGTYEGKQTQFAKKYRNELKRRQDAAKWLEEKKRRENNG